MMEGLGCGVQMEHSGSMVEPRSCVADLVSWWKRLEGVFTSSTEELYRRETTLEAIHRWRIALAIWLVVLTVVLITYAARTYTMQGIEQEPAGLRSAIVQKIFLIYFPVWLFLVSSNVALCSPSIRKSLHMPWHCAFTVAGLMLWPRLFSFSSIVESEGGAGIFPMLTTMEVRLLGETAAGSLLSWGLQSINILMVRQIAFYATSKTLITMHMIVEFTSELHVILLLISACFVESYCLVMRERDARAIWLKRHRKREDEIKLHSQRSLLSVQKTNLEKQAVVLQSCASALTEQKRELSNALCREKKSVSAFRTLVQSYCDAVVLLREDTICDADTSDPMLKSIFQAKSFMTTVHPLDVHRVQAALSNSAVSSRVNARLRPLNFPGATPTSLSVAITCMTFRDEDCQSYMLLGIDTAGAHAQSHDDLPLMDHVPNTEKSQRQNSYSRKSSNDGLTDSLFLSSDGVDVIAMHTTRMFVEVYISVLIAGIDTALMAIGTKVGTNVRVESGACLGAVRGQPPSTLPLEACGRPGVSQRNRGRPPPLCSSPSQNRGRSTLVTLWSGRPGSGRPGSSSHASSGAARRGRSRTPASTSAHRTESPWDCLPSVGEVAPFQGTWRWDDTVSPPPEFEISPWLQCFRITHRICTLADGEEVYLRVDARDRCVKLEGGKMSIKQGVLTRTGKSGAQLCFIRRSTSNSSIRSRSMTHIRSHLA